MEQSGVDEAKRRSMAVALAEEMRNTDPRTFKKYALLWCTKKGYGGGIKKCGSDHNVCPTCLNHVVGIRLAALRKAKATARINVGGLDEELKTELRACIAESGAEVEALEAAHKKHMLNDSKIRILMNQLRRALEERHNHHLNDMAKATGFRCVDCGKMEHHDD